MSPEDGHNGWDVWTLKDVFPPGGPLAGHRDLRKSRVAQEMERVLVALVGPTAIDSAVGGFHYPWNAHTYDGLITQMIGALQTPPRPPPAQTALNFNTVVRDILARRRTVAATLTDAVIQNVPFDKALEMAGSVTRTPGSATILKDPTAEAFGITTPAEAELSYFGEAAGPGPQLERRLFSHLDQRWEASGGQLHAYQMRAFWDFIWASLTSILLLFHLLTMEELLERAKPGVIRVESAEVAFMFAEGHILTPETAEALDLRKLRMKDWVGQACSLFLLRPESTKILVIFSLHNGSVKYAPVLATLRTRLIYLSMAIQCAAEKTAAGWDEYTATRRRALASRAVELQQIVSPIEIKDATNLLITQKGLLPLYEICGDCGTGFLADHNTQHRCGRDLPLMRVTHLRLDRRVLLALFEVVEAFGLDDEHEFAVHDVAQVLQQSNIWSMFVHFVREAYPKETAAAEVELRVDDDTGPATYSKSNCDAVHAEYDVLMWFIIKLLKRIHGGEALNFEHCLKPNCLLAIVAQVQRREAP
ncbi:hypothetical protein OC844_006739, partial [Tilletia horrida]